MILQILQILVMFWLVWVFFAALWIITGAYIHAIDYKLSKQQSAKIWKAYCDCFAILTLNRHRISFYGW